MNKGMSLNEILDSSLKTIPGCESICYVDMLSCLVLASRSHMPRPQEIYDAIAQNAVLVLRGGGVSSMGSPDATNRRIYLFSSLDVKVFLQPEAQEEHALCCEFNCDADIESATSALDELRQKIGLFFDAV